MAKTISAATTPTLNTSVQVPENGDPMEAGQLELLAQRMLDNDAALGDKVNRVYKCRINQPIYSPGAPEYSLVGQPWSITSGEPWEAEGASIRFYVVTNLANPDLSKLLVEPVPGGGASHYSLNYVAGLVDPSNPNYPPGLLWLGFKIFDPSSNPPTYPSQYTGVATLTVSLLP